MTSIQLKIIKITLYVFFVYVLLLNGIEQFFFLNFGIFNVFFSLLGLLFTWHAPIKYSLLYRLLIFPVIGTSIYEDFIKPNFSTIFHIQDIFWIFYIFLIILITHQKKVWLLFIVSIWGFFATFNTLPVKLFEQINYWDTFKIRKEKSPVIQLIQRFKTDHQNIYLICLDGYPNLQDCEYARESILPNYLIKKRFSPVPNISIGDTPQSVSFLLTNKEPFGVLYAIPLQDYNQHIKQMMVDILNENSIEVNAVFGNFWLCNLFFPLFPPSPVNYYLKKLYKKIYSYPEKNSQKEYIENFHQELISKISLGPKIQFFHFITFHGLGYEGDRNFIKDIQYADFWLVKAIEKIEKINPRAHVIIFSDHGERFIKGFDRKKSILFFK
ncbi:MAG: hypothetical protein RJA76_1503 [Bacteroidota bacterium]|jgi:hypothetical protein